MSGAAFWGPDRVLRFLRTLPEGANLHSWEENPHCERLIVFGGPARQPVAGAWPPVVVAVPPEAADRPYALAGSVAVDLWAGLPQFETAAEILLAEGLGETNGVRVKFVLGADANGECHAPSLDGNGLARVLWSPLVNRFQYVERWFGPVARVFGYHSGDALHLTWKHTRPGMHGQMEVVRASALPVRFAPVPVDERWEITGLSGILWLNGVQGSIRQAPPVVLKRGASVSTPLGDGNGAGPAVEHWRAWLRRVNGAQPGIRASALSREGLYRAARVTEAALEALRTGVPVDLAGGRP